MRVQRVGLEYHGQTALRCGDLADNFAFNLNVTRGDVFEASDHAQQRGFTAARRADEHAELSGFDQQINAVDHLGIVVGLADLFQL